MSEMNAMRKFMRPLVAVPVLVALSFVGELSAATTVSIDRGATIDAHIARFGFLDFKTLLFSPETGENLDGVSNQIRFIGPDTFKSSTFRPSALDRFKKAGKPLVPTRPSWGWDNLDKDLEDLGVVGEPLPASSGLIDSIFSDIKTNIQNHGVTRMSEPGIGAGTASYFSKATQDVIDQIIKLENPDQALLAGAASKPALSTRSYLFVFALGLSLLIVGLWWRRTRKKAERRAGPPVRTADLQACIEAINNSPIQVAEDPAQP